MGELEQIRAELKSKANNILAANYKKYLKSPYNFYGLRVPELRKIAKQYSFPSIYETFNLFDELWKSGNHEEMCIGLFLFANHKKELGEEVWNFLTKPERLEKFKTWDHVDEVSSHTLGVIFEKNPSLTSEVKNFASSKNPWIRRIAIVSQAPSIKKRKIQLCLLLAEKLVYDEDIYVQKGTGWMLREAGKINPQQVESFIKIHKNMKSAALSYSTEKMLHLRKLLKEEKLRDKLKENQAKSEKEILGIEN